jgi:hypothetical protein
MKKLTFIFISIFYIHLTNAQEQLTTMRTAVQQNVIENCLQWASAYLAKTDTTAKLSLAEYKRLILDSVSKKEGFEKRYKENIKTIIEEAELLPYNLGDFFRPAPVNLLFTDSSGKEIFFFIDGATDGRLFDAAQASTKKRASQVVSTYIFPAIISMGKLIEMPGVEYIGYSFTYASYNKKYAGSGLRAEYLCMFAPIVKVKEYLAKEISEADLFHASRFFIKDRDMLEGVREIKLDAQRKSPRQASKSADGVKSITVPF